MCDSQTGSLLQFLKAEFLIDLRVLAAISPGVHHYHLVTAATVEAELLLIGSEGFESRQFSAVTHSEDTGIDTGPLVRTDVGAFYSKPCNGEMAVFSSEVRARIAELGAGARGLLQEEIAVGSGSIPEKQQIATVGHLVVRNELPFSHKSVVPVGHVPEFNGFGVPVPSTEIHLVKDSLNRFCSHIGNGFNVLPVRR